MGNIVFNQAAKFLSKRRNTRRWIAAVLCLALVVTSGTFGMLMRHGSALSNTKMLDCAFEVHEHSNACYDEAGELVCGYADYCVHTHNDDCYDSENNLVCKLPEIEAHVHEDSCFEEEQCLICEMEETEGHQHTEECYQIEQNELTCTMEEHVHDDSCYELIPEGEEIPQDESTAPSEAPVPNEETSPSEEPVQNQESSATETPAQNPEAPATEAPATEAPAENQEAPVTDPEAPVTEAPADQTPAESQPAPENQPAPQSEEPTAEGEVARIAGLTKCVENRRLTCTMEEHTHSENCYNQTKVLICEEEETSEPHTHTEECYETKMVAKCGQLELHTHSDACYTDGKLTCGQLELVEHIHGEECFKDVPVMELTAQVDNVTITVSVTQEGIIPAGAELSVTPVVKTETEVLENLEDETQKAQAEALNAMYDEIQQGLETSMEDDDTREIKDFLAYDISFYKENENSQKEEVQLDGQVNVKLEFAQDALPEEIASNQDVQIENVDVYDVKETEEGRTAQVQQDAVVDTAQSADNGAVPAQDAGVRKVETTLSDSSTIAIAWIGEIDPETGEYVYEDDDVIIRVSALVEGAIPENAKLQVVPIIASQETGEQYQQVAEKLLEQAENKEYEIAGFLAYDISFVDEEGNKIEPNGEVKVSMNYKEAMIPAEVDATAYALAAEEETSQGEAAVEPELNVKVMHLEESSEGSVNVVDMAEENKVTALETTEEQKIQNAEFVTGGFSVFTITWTWDTSTPYVYEDDQVKITITAIDKDAIPKGTSLAITPIKADDVDTAQQYQEVARKLMEKAAGESYDIEGFLAYDISLIGEDGQEIEPDGKVKVTMEYKQPMAVVEIDPETYALVKQELAEKAEDVEAGQQPSSTEEDMATSQESMENAPVDQENSVTDNSETVENPVAQTENMMNRTLTDSSDETSQDEAQTDLGTPEEDNAAEIPEVQSQLSITVMHLEEDDNGEVAQVVDMMAENKVQSLEATEEQEIQKAEFITDSFSSFAIVWAEMNQVIGNVKFWDIEAKKEIEVANPEDYRLVLSNYGSINSTAINEGYDDAKKYTTIKDVQGKKYVFAEMKVADKSTRTPEQGESIDVIINYEGKFAYPGGDGIPVPFAEDKECYFLYNATDPLPTINTIDHKKSGITMRMINHRDRDGNQTTTAGQGGSGANGLMDIVKTEGHYDSTGKWVPPEIEAMGTKVGVYPDLVQKKLINGYPVLKDGTSLSQLFAGGTEVNNLFSEDKFNGTGYFEYDSSENYAHLNDDGNFTVYSVVGAPKGQGEAYRAGNFFPYNDITKGNASAENPNLHWVDEPDYYFGMYMEASFIQPTDGKVKQGDTKSPMVYEFNGDDDLWIFIDDVLVLDLGGVHFNCSGSIDFSNGQITVNGEKQVDENGEFITIRDKFESAGILPVTGEAWDANKAKDLFTKDGTFADYTGHTLKMFYMERGAGASTLHIKMNIPPIPKDTVQVTKQLKSSDPKYANVDFQFQLYAQKIKPGTENEYLDEYEPVKTNATVANNTSGEGEALTFDSNGVFTLKPGQTASFKDLAYDRKYYVVELGVEEERYKDIIVNGSSYITYDSNNNIVESEEIKIDDGKIRLETPRETVGNRKYVVFTNDCSEKNSQPLFVKKVMPEATDDTEPFKMKIWMEETESEKLQPYSGDYYLFKEVPSDPNDEKSPTIKHYYSIDGDDKQTLVYQGTTPTLCGTTTDGIVMIPAGYTVETGKVVAGTGYAVEELDLDPQLYGTPDIKQTNGDLYIEGEEPKKPTDQTGKIEAIGRIKLGEGATVQVTNKPIGQYQWEIVKKSTSSDVLAVEGAKFTLTSVPIGGSTAVTYIGESNDAGKIVWSQEKEPGKSEVVDSKDIPKGIYTLQETSAPGGYIISEEIWTIELSNVDIKITKPSKSDNTQNVEVSPTETSTDGKKVTYTFYNTPQYALPSTGGEGVYWYSIGGTLLMMAGALILYRNKRKQVRGCRRA